MREKKVMYQWFCMLNKSKRDLKRYMKDMEAKELRQLYRVEYAKAWSVGQLLILLRHEEKRVAI